MSESKIQRKRTEANINAEIKSEQHRIHIKFSANTKKNPEYAKKFKAYKDANLLHKLFSDALNNAPEDPNDYI